MELAVNMPEHEPQVGQACSSILATSSSLKLGSAAATMESTKSSLAWPVDSSVLPASIGPPETKIAGMLSLSAASNMPGVILSQLEMQTRASALWACTMYSTLSAISSRLGRE